MKEQFAKALNAMHGGAVYAAAVMSGNLADQAERERRRDICRGCASRMRVAAPGAIGESDWCGPPLEDRRNETPATCGCLLIGKTAVRSERCPQGKWTKGDSNG